MNKQTKWYVHTDDAGLEKLLRFLRKDNSSPSDIKLPDGNVRRLLEITSSQKNHIRAQQRFLRITYTIYYNDGHGVRPWNV